MPPAPTATVAALPLQRLVRLPARQAYVVVGLVYVALHVALDRASFFFPYQGLNITPWNPPAGLTLALLLLGGLRYAPLAFVAALLGDIALRKGAAPLGGVVAAAMVPSLGYAAVAWVLVRLKVNTRLPGLRDVAMTLVAGCTGAALVALGSVAIFAAAGAIEPGGFIAAAFRYWIGDCLGVGVVTPFLLRLGSFRWRRAVSVESAGQALALAAVWWVVFRFEATDEYKFFYLFFLPISWIALRAGFNGTVAALAALQVALILSIVSEDRDVRTLIELQVLLLALAAVGQFTGIVVDERRMQERARQALRDQLSHLGRLTLGGEIASGVAHEVNQPLAAAVSYLQAARRAAEGGADASALVAKAEAQALRAGETLHRMREFLRHGVTRSEVVPAATVTADAAALVDHLVRAAGATLTVAPVPPGLAVRADPTHVVQILVNLLTNAVDSLGGAWTGPKRIGISAGSEGDSVRFDVTDSGPGVAAEDRARIFDSFFTTKSTGMGLGLSISRTLVEAMGGSISYVAPKRDEPTRFSFTLPAAETVS
jgi:two-component system, LuxR family, sensor kinase FixL